MNILANILAAIRRFFGWVISPQETAASLDALARANPERLDWRHSVVDLLKLTNQDSSLEARKKLAAEFNYAGEFDGSAPANRWLHQKVMEKLFFQDGIETPGQAAYQGQFRAMLGLKLEFAGAFGYAKGIRAITG